MSCREKYYNDIVANSKKIIIGNATSYIEGKNYIDIPFNKNSKFIKTKEQAVLIARNKAEQVNKLYQATKFGNTASVSTNEARYARIYLMPTSKLLDAYEVKNGQKEPNLLFQRDDNVNYTLKAITALQSDKVRQPSKNFQGFINDLQKQGVPKEQIEIVKETYKEGFTKDEIITSLLANNSFVIEINVGLEEHTGAFSINPYNGFQYNNSLYKRETVENRRGVPTKNGIEIDNTEFNKIMFLAEEKNAKGLLPTQHYSNLTVPGGINYTENEIKTPDIIPSIKGHAQFSTDNGIGWFRSDEQVLQGEQQLTEFNPVSEAHQAMAIDYIDEEGYPVYKNVFKTVGGTSTKTRRILEVQSDLFQKGKYREKLTSKKEGIIVTSDSRIEQIEEEGNYLINRPNVGDKVKLKNLEYEWNGKNWYNLGEESTNQDKFLQLLNKDQNWVKFFIQSVINNSAKSGYETVLFPTGDTVSKIEGHETLEEFKKEKELTILRIEAAIEEAQNDWSSINKGEITVENQTKSQALDTVYKKIKNLEKEKEQYQQELERVETEGFGALKPIYNFYETQIPNILKKTYGKENIQRIKDEYGNEWWELKINPERDLGSIALQLISKSPNKEVNTELNTKLTQFLNQNGISVTNLDSYKEWYKLTYNKDLDVDPTALADLTNKIIAVAQDKEKLDTLPEEASHFIVEGMNGTELQAKLLDLVSNDPIYKEVVEQYSKLYNNDEYKLRKEALGKLLANSFIKQYTDTTKSDSRLITGLKRLIEKFLNLFRKNKNLTNELDKIAKEILSGNKQIDVSKLEDNTFYQLDEEKYKESTTLDSLKSHLEDIIKKRVTRLKIYENKALSEYSKEEKVRVEKLHKAYIEDKISLGIVNFINDIDHDAEATWNKLKKVEGNAIETAKVLREIKAYVIPFNETLKDIKLELNDNEANKEILDELTRITSKLDDLERLYNKKVKIVLSQFLFNFASNNKNINSPDDLLKKLEEEKDISIISRFLDSMAESTDDILGLFDRITKESKEKARIAAVYKTKDLLNLDKQLKDAGIKDNNWMYEKLNDNNTGNLVTEYNREEYRLARNQAWNDIKTILKDKFNIELPQDENERDLVLSKNKEANKEWKGFWKDWGNKNTKVNPKAVDLISKKKAYFESIYGTQSFKSKLKSDIAFEDWYNKNTMQYVDAYTGDVTTYMKGELILPADKYKNNAYSDIMSNPLKKKYYDKIMAFKEEQDKYLPENLINPYLAPQIRKDWLERAKENPGKAIKEGINDIKSIREDDTDFGMQLKLTDTEDKPVNFLPVHYTTKIQDTKDLSTDLTATMGLYIAMSEDYKEMQKVINVLELGEEVLANRKVVEGDSAMNKILDKMGLSKEKAYSRQRGGNSYERYKDWMEMVVYGKKKADEKWLNGIGINTVKAVDLFNKYTSVQALAINVYSGVNNTLIGNALARQEAFSREFIGKGGLTFADKTYWGNLPGFLDSVGNPYSDNKLKLVGDLMDVMQDFSEKSKELNTDRSRAGHLLSSNSLYMINSAGEHQIQWRTALAVMENVKLKDGDKTINLWDALEVSDGKITFKEGLKTEDGKDFTMDNVISTGLRIKALNQKLHGIYTDSDRSAIQKWALGRMGLMFRKWIKPGLNRRFDPKRFDYSLDSEVEGMYVSTWNFLKKVKGDLSAYSVIYNELSPMEKGNLKRTALEVAYMIASAILGAILMAQIDGDDDEKALAFAAYQANRMYTDLMFYTPLLGTNEQLKIIKSPMAGVKTLQGVINLLTPFTSFNMLAPINDEPFVKRYKAGKHKGESKLYVQTTNLVPIIQNIRRLQTPEEQIKYFNSTF